MIKTQFLLRDRFDQDVELNKTYADSIIHTMSELEILFHDFDSFISSLGYPQFDIDIAKRKFEERKNR